MKSEEITNQDFNLEDVFEVDDYMYFYGDSLTTEHLDTQINSMVGLLELNAPMDILDLACGFGRHANRLAALGHTVTGMDYIPGFLEIARRQAESMGVNAKYLQGDMREIVFENAFDRVLILFTTFGYFSDEENAMVLKKVGRSLKPGGLLGFDIPNRDATLKTLPPLALVEKARDLMINRNSFDTHSGRWHNQRIIIRNGIRKDKPFSIRLYNPSEIQSLVQSVGLDVYKLYSDWDGHSLSPDAKGMVVIAKKSQ